MEQLPGTQPDIQDENLQTKPEGDTFVTEEPQRKHGKQEDGYDAVFSSDNAEPPQHSVRTEFYELPEDEGPPDHVRQPFHGSYGRRKTDTSPVDEPGKGRRRIPSWIVAEQIARTMPGFHVNHEPQDEPHESWDPGDPPEIDPFS